MGLLLVGTPHPTVPAVLLFFVVAPRRPPKIDNPSIQRIDDDGNNAVTTKDITNNIVTTICSLLFGFDMNRRRGSRRMNSRTRTIKTMISVYCDAWLIVGSSVSKPRDLSRIDSGLKFDYFLLHTPMYGNYYQVKCTSTYFQFSFRFDFWLTFFLPSP